MYLSIFHKPFFIGLYFLSSLSVNALDILSENCFKSDNDVTFQASISGRLNPDEVRDIYEKEYAKGERLLQRVFFENGIYKAPRVNIYKEVKNIKLPNHFIEGVISQLEQAAILGHFDYLVREDLGHSHFLIPIDLYNNTRNNTDIADTDIFYEKLLNDKRLRILYHAAENYRFYRDGVPLFENDPFLKKRLLHRNILGVNEKDIPISTPSNLSGQGNTVRFIGKNFRFWGSGFTLKATKNGCFSYRHREKIVRFDISFYNITRLRRTKGNE